MVLVEQNTRAALAIADRGSVLVEGRDRLSRSAAGCLADPEVARALSWRTGRAGAVRRRSEATHA